LSFAFRQRAAATQQPRRNLVFFSQCCFSSAAPDNGLPPSPLAGLRVLELASVLAGPSTGQFLAELGADVIKVENRRTRGDVTRGWRLPNEAGKDGDRPAYFRCCNMGKRSIAIDASIPGGQKLVRELALASDVVLASYKPGDAEKFGLDAESLRKQNPRIVYAQITGYGLDDPRVGYDAIIQAEAGFTYMNGEPGDRGQPTKMPVAMVDLFAAHQLKQAILLALWRRDKTGEGGHVHVSLMAAAVASLANQATGYLFAGAIPERMGSDHPSICPYGTAFYDKEGEALILAVGADSQFRSLCEIIGRPELASDERFQTNAQRVHHRDTLKAQLATEIAKFGREELLKKLSARNVPAGAVAKMNTVFEQRQAEALVMRDDASRDAMGLRQVAWLGDGIADWLPKTPPSYGEHSREILSDVLGLSASDVDSLVGEKVVDAK